MISQSSIYDIWTAYYSNWSGNVLCNVAERENSHNNGPFQGPAAYQAYAMPSLKTIQCLGRLRTIVYNTNALQYDLDVGFRSRPNYSLSHASSVSTDFITRPRLVLEG